MFKFVVLCTLVAVVAAKPWNPAVLTPTLFNNVPVLVEPRYIPAYPAIFPVVQDTPILLTSGPAYVHAIKKRTLGVLENATLGAAAAAVNAFTGSIISANGASANAVNPQTQGQVQTVHTVQTVPQQTQGQTIVLQQK